MDFKLLEIANALAAKIVAKENEIKRVSDFILDAKNNQPNKSTKLVEVRYSINHNNPNPLYLPLKYIESYVADLTTELDELTKEFKML